MRRALILLLILTLLAPLAPTAAAGQQIGGAGDVLDWSARELDGYYRTLFALGGNIDEYTTPRVTILAHGETVSTGCTGPIMGDDLAFYCSLDAHIVMSEVFLDELAEGDDFLPAYVLAHEWAHHIQRLSGTIPVYVAQDGDWNQVYIIENELRADCLAGAWMGNVAHRGYLNATDMSAVFAKALEVGDSGIYGRTRSHGTGVERLRAVFLGYEEGALGCMSITPLPRGGM